MPTVVLQPLWDTAGEMAVSMRMRGSCWLSAPELGDQELQKLLQCSWFILAESPVQDVCIKERLSLRVPGQCSGGRMARIS